MRSFWFLGASALVAVSACSGGGGSSDTQEPIGPTSFVSVASAPAADEGGPADSATLVFPLGLTEDLTSDAAITYEIDDGAPQTTTLVVGDGAPSITVERPGDDVFGGDKTVTLTLTDVSGDNIELASSGLSATGTIRDDEKRTADTFYSENGILVVELEGWEDELPGHWRQMSSAHGSTGDGFLFWDRDEATQHPVSASGSGVLGFKFQVDTSGSYALSLRGRRPADTSEEPDSSSVVDAENSLWVRVLSHDDSVVPNEAAIDGWVAMVVGDAPWGVWTWTSELLSDNNNLVDANWSLEPGVSYIIEVSGRSENFQADRMIFGLNDPVYDATLPQSLTTPPSDPSPDPTPPAENSAPVAVADVLVLLEDTPVTIDALENDSDPDGDALAPSIVTRPKHGSVSIDANDMFVYRPNANFFGADSFRYAVSDGSGGSAEATVTLTVEPVPDAPKADAGQDVTVSASTMTSISLNGSNSQDADGDTLSYQWTVSSQPTGVTTSLSNAETATPSFLASIPGSYEFSLSVSDSTGFNDRDTVIVTVTNTPPVAVIGAYPRSPVISEDVTLDASASYDPNGHEVSVFWEVVTLPENSGMQPLTYKGAVATMTFDVHGQYTLRLSVDDGYAITQSDTVIDATVFSTVPLKVGFADAEFNTSEDAIVTVLDDVLSVIDASGEQSTLALPLDAVAVSVAPAGDFAAVAHDGWISHIDLSDTSVAASYSVPANLIDIILDDNGDAHGIAGSRGSSYSVNRGTGDVKPGSGGYNIRGYLHPSGDKIYAADNGLSPSDLLRYDIVDGAIVYAYDTPYHGDYGFCGDVWYGPSGDTILSPCRVVVRATEDRSSDLTFVMQIDDGAVRDGPWYYQRILHASSSAFDNLWYTVDQGNSSWGQSPKGSEVFVYSVETGQLNDNLRLPYIDDDATGRWKPRFVFADNESSSLRVLAVDDHDNPQAYALLLRKMADTTGTNQAPVAVVKRYQTVRTNDDVTLDASASSDPEGVALSYIWALESAPDGASDIEPTGLDTAYVQFSPPVAGVYLFSLRVDDGVRQSALKNVSINVFDDGETAVHRIAGAVADLEYSKSLNAVVYLSGEEALLHILDLSDFSEKTVSLPRFGYRVGIAPNGLRAAVAHGGQATLIDLSAGSVLDAQDYNVDWGDIVLDDNSRAHLVPWRDQWEGLTTIDFAGDRFSTAYSSRAGTQLRMHPKEPWVYGADRGLSPSDFEKWDVSTFPATSRGDSPYHGGYAISGDLWISEDGDRLLTAGGAAFNVSADPDADMIYSGSLANSTSVKWADHSTETDTWVIVAGGSRYSWDEDEFDRKITYYGDTFLEELSVTDPSSIPTAAGPKAAAAQRVFFSDDGTTIVVQLEGEDLLDNVAIQVGPADQ